MRIIFNGKCIECKKSPLVYDELHGELFCLSCGLIQKDNYSNFSIMDYLKYHNTYL